MAITFYLLSTLYSRQERVNCQQCQHSRILQRKHFIMWMKYILLNGAIEKKLPKIWTLRDHIKSAPCATNYLMESQPGVNEMSELSPFH